MSFHMGVHNMSNTTTVITNCRCCKSVREVTVPSDGYHRWQMREALIQDALPEVSADDREFLISQTCPDCWTALFQGEED